ncbi:MAG: hypothetical protein Q9P01_12845, partial [Anaerolineae bacterium]|nr:hypothetical protein [Anaerolineae bacterium]
MDWQQGICIQIQRFSQFAVAVEELDHGGIVRKINALPKLPGRALWAQIWRVQVGRVRLYLLDTSLSPTIHMKTA